MDSSSARGSTGQLSSSGSTGGGMHHSLSTPAGVDGGARTPPATPKKGSKMLAIRVQMLDDTETIFQVQAKALGRVLFEQVCKQLHLLEADYFGLEYADAGGTRYWLDLQKPISRQLGLSLVNPLLYFCVKFYTPDPGQLEEEYTRYLFCLQVKRDLSHGLMQCNENTAALMASYIVQAECGDYVAEDYPDHKHLSSYKFVPQQDQEMERKIMENHKKHAGQTPAEADLNLLETARRCELYGMKMHPAKDHENVPLNLAVAHMGILVFQNYTKINTFSWAKIRKISFKRKRFLIKLHPEGYGYYKDTVEFFFEGRNECKNFWKKCVENHGFFRCSSVKHVSRHKTRVLSRGSSFRYSGKTQKQIVEFVRDNYVKRQTFQRSASFRHSSAHSSASNMHASTVGNSISAHPLLPLADSNLSVEASKLSASLGSMGAVAGAPASPTTRSASRHHATATSWSSVPDTRATTTRQQPPPPPVRTTTTLPSPPPTMPSSAQTTTVAAQAALPPPYQPPCVTSSPLAVRAAVHRADITTGTTTTIIMNHTPPPPPAAATRTSSTPHTAIPRTPSSHSPPPPLLFTTTLPLQTQSQSDLGGNAALPAQAHRKRQLWTRSASCRDLYDFSFEDSGKAKRRAKASKEKQPPVAAESPITRYDDHRAIYAGSRDSSLEIHQDIMMPDLKVYSSSYPGTTSYSQESVEDPGNYDLRDSQDDLSHDSYELIEKSDDDTSGDYKYHRRKPAKPLNTRSCSLDSGNYLPSDNSESEEERRHKSSYDIFNMEDPRDLPREITPRKSDGSFYKAFKATSRTSSLESYEKPRSRGHGSRASSTESRSEYYDAASHAEEHQFHEQQQEQHEEEEEEPPLQVLYHPHEFDRKISFERNYGVQMLKCDKEVKEIKETKHVHSMSLQNVEMERGSRVVPEQQNTIPRTAKATYRSEKSSSSEVQPFINAHVWSQKQSTESESNIFSFDEDKIQSLQQESAATTARRLKDFMEIEPRKCRESLPLHQPIERTKSDPNSLARQRINSSARRMLLMHQKSIDLTPAESSDEDYLYKQIPSAPPIMKYRGSHFEMPSAEFGHFDILARGVEGQKTKFEVPKSQFEILGAKTQSDFINLPPKSDDIPYVLHKRHVMNGTATKDEIVAGSNTAPQDAPPPKPVVENPASSSFLFTQNVDLSKIDPVTLEVDKSEAPIHLLASPKRDITHIDPVLLEALNSKLSQIESDSPTSSKTESLKPQILQKLLPAVVTAKPPQPPPPKIEVDKKEITHLPPKKAAPSKQDLKKRIIKPRMQPGKKSGRSNKTKVRITSFSSDDESLDSDDVFGTAEATPTRMEFSPPQMRKEMESILKYESERKYLQYTMSSTEVEGSPPQIRKKATQELDPNVATSELRRISERSISIPSSEDDLNIKTADLQPVFEPPEPPGFAPVLSTVQEYEKLQAEIEDDIKNLQVPPKTKITDLSSLRRKGQSPLLFAHARLNLSEGSAFTLLQRQQAAESPLPGRRAKSLDTPVISVSRLPPLNAFSSKDDTVEEELQALSTDQSEPEGNERQPLDFSSQPSFQFSPQPSLQLSPQPSLQLSPQPSLQFSPQPSLQLSPQPSLQLSPQPSQQLSPQSTPQPSPQPSIERDQIVPDLLKHIKKSKAALQAKSKRKAAAAAAKAAPRPPAPDPETEENIDKGQESDASARRAATKEKAKSLEKLELKRVSSKERSRSQDDSDTDRRKEKQQMLYETAIKQTKTIKSPVKDAFPVFPQVEEMVRERHGKLEISINTIENTKVSLEEAIIITKSPKKLDKKLTKSLELNLEGGESTGDEKTTVQRLGKSLDLETRPKLEVVEADIHKEPTNIVLEGTSLDVWLSMEKPASIAVPEESESGSAEAKAISPSEASSKPIVMLGTGGIEVLQQGTDFFEEATPANGKPPDLGKIEAKSSSDSQSLERVSLGNSLDIKYIDDSGDSSHKSEQDSALVAELQKASDTVGKFLRRKLEKRKARATSEEESLTEVSDLKADGAAGGSNYLTPTPSKESLLRLSVERSRSEETGSWMTIECEECVGDSFETEPEPDENLLMTKQPKLLKRTSSDTTGSWTSGEKDQQSPSPNINKETDDSSVSCALGQAMGYSQNIEKFGGSESSPEEAPRSPRSPRSPRICVLGRAFTIDEESGGGSSGDEGLPPYKKTPYPFEDKWAPELSTQQLQKPGQHKLLSSTDKLSTESRNSLDTESSSGSLGAAARMQKSGDIPKELSSTWKPFPLDSSGSESFDDAILPQDNIVDNICDITPTRDDTELPEDLANFSITYPCITSNIASLGLGGGTFLSRTLSRISERSTNSEKSSLEEDSTKASTQSDSLNDSSSNPQVSLSSDPPSNAMKTPTNDLPPPPSSCYSLLQRQISDDRRTSAEMAELSIDDIEIITSERGLKLKRQGSDDTIIDEEYEGEAPMKGRTSSQESEEWPLPDIPQKRSLMAMHELQSSDTSQQTTQVFQAPVKVNNIPKVFGLRGSLKSQDSEQWPSPPSSVAYEPVTAKIETYYIASPEEADKVTVESSNVSTYDNDSISGDDKTSEIEKTHTYENVATERDSISESLSLGTGVKIVLASRDSNSDEDLNNSNDDVFTSDTVEVGTLSTLRPPTSLRRSTTSEDSSHSAERLSATKHSSEEDCTSSMGFEDGTVRYALKPAKCTHSSHSEDTSIGLSLSEWSNSNTVKFQNMSSNSGTTKSDASLSEWSSSNSNTLKAAQSSSLAFQKLSSTSTGDSTLTDLLGTASSSEHTLVPQQFLSRSARLGSSIDDVEALTEKSPKNIPSEDFSMISVFKQPPEPKYLSTERPIVIPPSFHSDTEKSSSSEVQRTCASAPARTIPMKLAKCPHYYSSSLSSESTPLASTSPNRTATFPLTRPRKSNPPSWKSAASENDSTSSVESPKNDRRERRRRKQSQKRHHPRPPSYQEVRANVEEGYLPDGDSQSGSDIFRMEKDDEFEIGEGFDVTLIPPPLLEDDFEEEQEAQI